MIWLLIILIIGAFGFYKILQSRNMQNWFMGYLVGLVSKPQYQGRTHVLFCFADHYEPQWRTDDINVERARVDRWCKEYREMANKHKDADGVLPQHSFFYPEEEYRFEHLAKLSDLCHQGYGEIEIHLHHDNDTAENFTKVMTDFAHTLHHEHGALPVHPETGQIMYAFIHGNWALDNSLPGKHWCGIDNELSLLNKTGCYVDMTLPSAPSAAQTSKINSIYYAKGQPGKCKGHDTGIDVSTSSEPSGDLMLIQGPLGMTFKMRNGLSLPNIDAGDVRKKTPPLKSRVDQWIKTHIHVKGRPEWVFVKIHTHGTQEEDMDTLLGKPRDDMHSYLEEKYNDGEQYILHYVSAREMYNIAKAAEAGKTGNPHDYRDFILSKPSFMALREGDDEL